MQIKKIKLNVRVAISFLCLSFLCSSCTQYMHYYEQKRQEQTTYVIQKQALEPFNKIVINGKAKVNMTYAKNSTVFLSGQKQYVVNVHISVVNNTLYVYAPDNQNANIEIHAKNIINSIVLKDSAIFMADNVGNNNLTLKIYDNAICILNGEYNLSNILQNSSQKIEVKWIYGDYLNIESHSKGNIYLAGAINALQIQTTKHAKIDAHYLKTKDAIVFAKDQSIAKIYPTNSLQAFADDDSLVAYFIRPQFLNKVTQKKGNILYFGQWI